MNASMSDKSPFSSLVVHAIISARLAYEFEADQSAILRVEGNSGHVCLEKNFSKGTLEGLVGWALSYGAEMEILEPLQLREHVAAKVRYAINTFYGISENIAHGADSGDMYIPSEMSQEDLLHASIQEKLSARLDLNSIEEVPATERIIELWIDIERLNPFDNSPLREGRVSMDFLKTQNKDAIWGLRFEGEWHRRTSWILSCCDSVCVLAPEVYRREVTEIINRIEHKYYTPP